MAKWLRTAGIVEALHLNRDVEIDVVVDFVTRASDDLGVSGRSDRWVITLRGREEQARIGDWLVLDKGHLHIVDNDTFVRQYEIV